MKTSFIIIQIILLCFTLFLSNNNINGNTVNKSPVELENENKKVIAPLHENIDSDYFYLSLSKYGDKPERNIFPVTSDLVYCNVRVINCQSCTIIFLWNHKDSSHSHTYEYKMPANAAARWRTCSYKHFHGLAGDWNVSVYKNSIDESNLLGSIDFRVE